MCHQIKTFCLKTRRIHNVGETAEINESKQQVSYIDTSSLNGSQLAKMKKSIPDMSCQEIYRGWSSWSKKLQIYLKKYDLCEYVKFGATSWKIDILSITASLKFESKNSFAHVNTYNCDYLQHSTFRFNLIDFQLNTDFPSQFCVFYLKIT